MRFRLRTLLIVLALGPPVLAGCVEVEEGGAGLGRGAPDEAIYCDPGPEFRAAREAARERAMSTP